MKILAVGTEFFHADGRTDGRTDGQTDRQVGGQTSRHEDKRCFLPFCEHD